MTANLITRIAARIDAEYDVDPATRDAAAEELATIARGKKMSAAKLSAQVIEDTLAEYMPDEELTADEAEAATDERWAEMFEEEGTMTDEINAASLESIRESMADEEDDNAQKLAALKAQDLNLDPTPAKATKARKSKADDAPKESRTGAHADCTHEVSKAARARCRRERAKDLAVAA